MKTVSSKPSLTGQQFELDQLLATNKSLAKEKRQLHCQKLRQYSEKVVKLKEIMKCSIDVSERKCLEEKLRVLEEKQDLQIAKLAKIDQIEKQIDQYMTEGDEDSKPQKNKSKMKKSFSNYQRFDNSSNEKYAKQNTPAKKITRKYNPPLKELNHEHEANLLQSSDNFDLINRSSTQYNQVSNKKNQTQKQFKISELKIKDASCGKSKKSKQSRVFSCFQTSKPFFERTKPNNAKRSSIKNVEKQQKSIQKQQNIGQNNYCQDEEQERFRMIHSRNKDEQKNVIKIQQRVNQLIEKQRQLMERIGVFEKQQTILYKKSINYINSIQKSRDIILSSGLILEQISELQASSKGSHQFSIDSLESNAPSDGSFNLSVELASFEKMLHQFLLSAQREVMLTSGQIQQCTLKVNRYREECIGYETKRQKLQNQNSKLVQKLSTLKMEFKALEDQCFHLKQETEQFEHFCDIRKKLVNELDEKCEKLKARKKSLSEKVLKFQAEIVKLEQKCSQKTMIQQKMEQNLQKLTIQQKQMIQSIILTEHKVEQAEKSFLQSETKLKKVDTQLDQANNSLQKILLQITENQKRLVDIQSRITNLSIEQGSLQERIRKIQNEINESTNILNDQRATITSQNSQINSKSNELLQWQKKIISVADSHRAIEEESSKLLQFIKNYKQQIEQLKIEKEQVQTANAELEQILNEAMTKKQALLSEVDLRSSQLETLIADLNEGHEQLKSTSDQYIKIEEDLHKTSKQYQTVSVRLDEIKDQLQEKMEEEGNIIARINKLKIVEKQLLLQVGLKGNSNKLDEELRQKVSEAISQLDLVSKLKFQLKQCKYENRRLRLDNQRLSKMVSNQNDSVQN